MTSETIAVVGLGSMGFGIAQSLVRAGHRVIGADINQTRVDALCAEGGHADDGARPDILVSVVLNAAQTEETLFGNTGWAARLRPGSVVIACATIPPVTARALEERCNKLDLHYLDAPISGGAAKAAEGALSVMAAGTPEAFERAKPALSAMAATVHNLGATAGDGSAMKAVNQLLAGSHIAVMAEALTFAASQGLELAQVVDVICASAGTSWMFENRAPHVVENDYAPRSSVTIWPKDLGIVAEIAQDAGVPIPMAQMALAQFQEAVKQGLGAEDDAALTKLHAATAGVRLPGDN